MKDYSYKKQTMFFKLFVKNFPAGTTEEELKIYFSNGCNNGEVTKVSIIEGTQQAFVHFERQDCCKLAKEFTKNVLFKSQFPLFADFCYPKQMRTVRHENLLDNKDKEKKKQQLNKAQIA